MRPNRGRIFVVVLALALFIPASAQEQPPGGGTPDVGAQIKALQEQINAEVAAREAGDSALEQAINAEESARIGADSILRANMDVLVAQIKALQEQINAEVAAREAADSALEQAINAEESARVGADSILRANIDAEESTRIAANADLADRIKVLEESRK